MLIAAAAQSMARIAILLVDQPLEDVLVAWVEWDDVIKTPFLTSGLYRWSWNLTRSTAFAARGLDGILNEVVTNLEFRPHYRQ